MQHPQSFHGPSHSQRKPSFQPLVCWNAGVTVLKPDDRRVLKPVHRTTPLLASELPHLTSPHAHPKISATQIIGRHQINSIVLVVVLTKVLAIQIPALKGEALLQVSTVVARAVLTRLPRKSPVILFSTNRHLTPTFADRRQRPSTCYTRKHVTIARMRRCLMLQCVVVERASNFALPILTASRCDTNHLALVCLVINHHGPPSTVTTRHVTTMSDHVQRNRHVTLTFERRTRRKRERNCRHRFLETSLVRPTCSTASLPHPSPHLML